MKKNTFLTFIAFLLFNSINAQVLWSENFESYTLGNIGTDVTGAISGQGNWYTRPYYNTSDSISNENFRINYETGRGKYLILESTTIEDRGIFKATSRYTYNDIGSIWNLKDATNNILKIEFEYNYLFYTSSNNSFVIVLTTASKKGVNNGHEHGLHAESIYNGQMGELFNGGNTPLPYLIADPNMWHKINIYVDINKNESYFEFPYKNYAIKSLGYISGSYPFNPLDLDRFSILLKTEDNFYGNSFLKVDNIKISAVNTLPTLNIIDLDSSKFNLYPNPATNIVNIINSENISVKQIEIYDLAGKLVNTQNFNNETEIQLNIETLTSGTYMLHLQTNEGTAIKKLIKK